MKTITATLKGIAPLMMHNERLANPRDPGTAALKKLTTQRKKTEELLEQIAEIEWRLGFYERDGKPVIPSDNVLACVKEGARKRKLGRQVEAGVFSQERYFALAYDGPPTIGELWTDGRFFDYRSVAVNQARTMRARPIFNEWSLPIELTFDEEMISKDDLQDALEVAGLSVGLCEKRPQFGRFTVEC
jgi:hypothetical protein